MKHILAHASNTILFLSLAVPAYAQDIIINEQDLDFKIPDLATVLTFAVQAFFVVGGLFALVYLLWGSFDWIVSGGDQAKVDAARKKIQAALVGSIVIVASLSLIVTLEKLVFREKICFGVSCPIRVPVLLKDV
jgi:Type IV secretion system pilin